MGPMGKLMFHRNYVKPLGKLQLGANYLQKAVVYGTRCYRTYDHYPSTSKTLRTPSFECVHDMMAHSC